MRLWGIIFVAFGLVACSGKPVSPEVLLGQVFDNLNVAMSYDKICHDSQTVKAVNANFFGNMQMLTALYGGELHYAHPEMTVDDIDKMLSERSNKVSQEVEKILTEKGCDSDKGKGAAKLLAYFTGIMPPVLFSQISDKVEKMGGMLHVDDAASAPSGAGGSDITPPEKR